MRRVGNDEASDYGGGVGGSTEESWSFRQGHAREDGFLIIRKGAYKNLEALDGEFIKEEGITESGSK